MEFSYSQTENFEMEKLSSDTGYLKKKQWRSTGGQFVLELKIVMNFKTEQVYVLIR